MKNIFLSLLTVLLSVSTCNTLFAEPLKVGVLIPLSGPIAVYGESVRNGIEMFKKEKPDTNIEFLYDDSKYEAQASISGFNNFIASKEVDLIFSWGTSPSAVLAPIAEFRKFPLILVTGDTSVNKGKEYSIDFSNELSEFSKAQLKELRKRGLKKMAIVKSEIQYIETLLKGMEDDLLPDEKITILDSFQPSNSVNFQSGITKLRIGFKKGQFDVLGVMLIPGQLSSFYKKLKDQNVSIATFGSDVFASQFERNESGVAMVGATYATENVTKEFEDRYKVQFKSTDQVGFAANAYDLATLLDNLFPNGNKDKKLTPKEILGTIETSPPRAGASGKYSFHRDDPVHDPVGGKRFKFPIVVKEVIAGGGERVLE